MITYNPFWRTIKEKNVTTYALRNKHNISNGTLYRMRRNKPLSTTTLDDLCTILNCSISDVVEFVPVPVKSEE